jgi:hypothetical protein
LKLNRRFGRTFRLHLHGLKVCQIKAQHKAGSKHGSTYCLLKATYSSETSFEFQPDYTALYHRKYRSSYLYSEDSDPILKSYLIYCLHKLHMRNLHILHIYLPTYLPIYVTNSGCWLDYRGIGLRVLVGVKIFSSPCRPDRFWVPPSLLSNGYRNHFLRG